MTHDGKDLNHEQPDSSEPDTHSAGTAGTAGTAGEIDDGMGANAPDDVAGEDEAVPGLDDDPLARANRS